MRAVAPTISSAISRVFGSRASSTSSCEFSEITARGLFSSCATVPMTS